MVCDIGQYICPIFYYRLYPVEYDGVFALKKWRLTK